MKDIVDLQLPVGNSMVTYHVSFNNELYTFTAKDKGASPASFSLHREHTEWTMPQPVPENIKQAAINHLEKYLLSQH